MVILLVLTNAGKSYSQVPGKEETVSYLNALGGDSVQFNLKGAVLSIRIVAGDQKPIREDKVNLVDLDTVVQFESESNLSFINCLSDYGNCVTRTLMVQKIKREYNRVSFPSAEKVHFGYAAALVHLVKITGVKNYKDEVVFPRF
jgi:hypothetical protein